MATHETITAKICSRCKRDLPLDQFYKDARKPNRRAHCRDCCNRARKAARENATPEEQKRALEMARQWKLDNAERTAKVKRAWDAANPEKAAESSRKASTKYRASNGAVFSARLLPHRFRRSKRKRPPKAELKIVPAWADFAQIDEVYRLCAERNASDVDGVEWQVDHIVPLQSSAVCGLHVQDNLSIIPKRQNIVKGNRHWPDMP
jgi:hypothetical protein